MEHKPKKKSIGPGDLDELYKLREQMEKFGLNVEDVNEKISEAEYFLLAYATDQMAEIAPRKIDIANFKGNITIAVEYKSGRLSRVGAGNVDDIFEQTKMYSIEIPN